MRFTDGIVYVDDFFSDEAIHSLEEGNYETVNYHDQRRSAIASREQTEIRCDAVDEELQAFMTSTELAQEIMEVADLSWRCVFNGLLSKETFAAISKYTPGGGMVWHCDHWNGELLNWICTLEGDRFIKWCDDPFPQGLPEIFTPKNIPSSIQLEPNRLVVMPSYYPHTIIAGEEERVSVHGHFKHANQQRKK